MKDFAMRYFAAKPLLGALPTLLIAALLASCAHSTIIPFQPLTGQIPATYPSTRPEEVGVYRSSHPFPAFSELGLITFRAYQLDLPAIYNQLRRDSAAQGADAVVDVKIHGETHTEFETRSVCVPRNVCSPTGACTTEDDCHTETIPTTVTTFFVEGSMIRKEGKP